MDLTGLTGLYVQDAEERVDERRRLEASEGWHASDTT